jgi:hypothetical protein
MDSGGGGDDSPSDAPTTQADASFGCMDPSTCASAMPVCCGTIPLTGGTIPNCTQGQISSACDTSAHCPTNIGLSCTGTQTVRLCKTSADCTEPSYNMCCTFGQSGGSLSFCANGVIAGGGGGTCH